jgi:hypothetical protein
VDGQKGEYTEPQKHVAVRSTQNVAVENDAEEITQKSIAQNIVHT